MASTLSNPTTTRSCSLGTARQLMDLRATVAAANLLDGILAAFDSPPSTANIQALSLACPPAMVLAALEMLDNGEGASSPPSLAGSTDEGT
jgi:hypothetical protein